MGPEETSILPGLPGVPEAKALWGCWEKNSTALKIYQNQPYTSYTSYTNDNLKHLAKSLAPGSDPKTCGPILFCCNSRICQLLLSNWEEKNKTKPLLQKTEIHLNQSQTLQISKVIRTGRDWSVTYRGRQKPHVSLGSEVAGSGLSKKKSREAKITNFPFSPDLSPFSGGVCCFANSELLKITVICRAGTPILKESVCRNSQALNSLCNSSPEKNVLFFKLRIYS